ncbi:type VI secretion system baseplate subunit TssG [Buttiauxella sp. A2-C1_F]|uniref:type VI secretion system baseplate subunit TssG n=1 Tax=Buttiauxella sp. A2-C1_F TaxID=2904526 RepID=UPI001E636E33|nr:type VI secretion system baseplate subunit TssG [Buttiauxella sp. A2-C1_F]MCE0844170.1 type VI secretion system baseplate subunit TssG [Buttiauxella sp. A2-C1_F]
MDLSRRGNRLSFYQQVRLLLQAVSRQQEGDKEQLLDDAIRFVSPMSLDAPKGEVGEISRTADGRWQLEVWSQGLTGALGALPTVYTEWLVERYYRYGDRAGKAFFDIFTHRMQCLRYLAWEKYHYYARAELREEMPLSQATRALSGVLNEPSELADGRYASLLAPAVRSMVNLETLLGHALAVTTSITPFSRHWLPTDERWCCQLGNNEQQLGNSPMLGRLRWEHQSAFLVTIGPISQCQALSFFPGEKGFIRLSRLLRDYLGLGLEFTIELQIENTTSPLNTLTGSQLGRDARLGDDLSQPVRVLRLPKELTECQY